MCLPDHFWAFNSDRVDVERTFTFPFLQPLPVGMSRPTPLCTALCRCIYITVEEIPGRKDHGTR